MSAASVLARGRAAAAALMADAETVSITRVLAQSTDDLTGVVTATSTQTIYSGPGRVQQTTAQGRHDEAGPASYIVVAMVLQLPVVGSEDVARDDRVTITASTHDPMLVGRIFRVRDLHHKAHATTRRLGIEEVT